MAGQQVGRRCAWRAAALALGLLLLAGAACGAPRERGQRPATPAIPAGPGPTLVVHQAEPGVLAFRSPTFRCALDSCAGAVIAGLEELLGKDRFTWRTAAIPGQETVEIVVRFDPARDPPARIVQAMVAAMERAPDPRYPGRVEVISHGVQDE